MHGKNRIGFDLVSTNGPSLLAYSPLKGEYLPDDFQTVSDTEIELAMQKATSTYKTYKHFSGLQKAAFLEAIADEILALGDALIERTVAESALPEARIIGERGRTIGQLKLFATLLREGSWVDAVIDTALPERTPLPRPDIRKMLVPVGPVVVFTASNFPLAFSTAGGDTASALAAGNPVIVKAHESHLGTNELISDAISRAAEKTGMPDGVFSSLVGSGYELGRKLVQHPLTKSVAFTGSYNGGMALYKLANERTEPIPVFAEMGSINPVYILPDKLEKDPIQLAKTYAGSITLGVGQFCTNPGLLVGIRSESLNQFASQLAESIDQLSAGKMLNLGIANAYKNNLEKALTQKGVKPLSNVRNATNSGEGMPLVATVTAGDFIANPQLTHEVFGPYSLLVICENADELLKVAQCLPGQLTNTLMATDADVAAHDALIKAAAENCGRLIFNGVPTGVEVCYSMHHGGPFPSATDSRFTSVGTDAIRRFVRPVSFQDAPEAILPAELKNGNPLGIWRKINGQMSNKPID